jgi:phosphoribosylformylglycinamidine synthase
MLKITENEKTIAEVPAKSLGDGPLYERPCEKPSYIEQKQKINLSQFTSKNIEFNHILLNLLESPNIASKNWVYEQYDHMVQTNTVCLPGKGDAAICSIKGSSKLFAITTDGNSRYCFLDPFIGGQIAVAEAARNLSCVGAIPLAITDCLNFGNPEKPEVMWQFAEAVKGISKTCKELNIPIISGNVSFYNETNGESIFPTPVIGMAGTINGLKFATMDFKRKDDIIILFGANKEEIGGSEFLKLIYNEVAGRSPEINLQTEKKVQECICELIACGFVDTAHDCAEGGLAIALAEMAISADFGAEIALNDENISDTALLFGESQSRIIFTVRQSKISKTEELLINNKLTYQILGKTTKDSLVIKHKDKVLIDLPISQIKDIYLNAIGKLMT